MRHVLSALTLLLTVTAQRFSQGTNYDKNFPNGSLRLILLLTTTSRVALTIREMRSGFSKEVYTRNGNRLDRFCGFTENVCFSELSSLTAADDHLLQPDPGKAYSGSSLSHAVKLELLISGLVLRSFKTSFPYAIADWPRWHIFTLILGTPTNKTAATCSLLSFLNFPPSPIIFATHLSAFISPTTKEHGSPAKMP